MPPETHPLTSRREFLGAAGAATLAGTAGCLSVQRARALFGRDSPTQISLTIKTLPTDADPWGIRTARSLAERLDTVGIRARVVPTSRIALLRDVLVNQSYDLYVARGPPIDDPDLLRSLLHSRYGAEPGWQNPFGYANLAIDDHLVAQRQQTGTRRRETLHAVQAAIARDQPFSVVAYADDIHAIRPDRLRNWGDHRFDTVLAYLALDPPEGEVPGGTSRTNRTHNATAVDEPSRPRTLRMTTTDSSASRNLNPLAVEYRSTDSIVGLLYDSLGVRIDTAVRPWLARDWSWTSSSGAAPSISVTLRDDLTWHDGTTLTARDVAFTYRFLTDTSMGGFESPLPAPRFRSRSSVIDRVRTRSNRTVDLDFVPCSRAVASRALTVPILPAHVWESKTERATLAGIDAGRSVTEAVIWENPDPVGSGPLAFAGSETRKLVALDRVDDHFLTRADIGAHLAPYRGGFAFDRIEFLVAPSGTTAVEMVEDGTADATATGVTPAAIPQIGRSTAMDLHVEPARSFYHVGFNVRRPPFGNPRFRRAIAQLLDKPHLVETIFDGYATPAATPLAHLPARAPELRWRGTDPELPFPGRDGQLAVQRARDAFRAAGYRYTDGGSLVRP